MSPKWLYSVLAAGFVSLTAFGLANAWFSDLETSPDNKFTAGILDLKIDGADSPAALFSLSDMTPGVSRDKTTTIQVNGNPAHVYLKITSASRSGEITYTLGTTVSNKTLSSLIGCWIPLGDWVKNTPKDISQTFKLADNLSGWTGAETLNINEEFYASQIEDGEAPGTLCSY
jgi:predicted ribosomally synthesized peptide with SipW-like signal peptide